jgi:hypothetical protein
MNANSFMLNNYIEYDGRIFQIDSISKEFPTLDTEEFGIGVVDWNNIKPIEITVEHLLNFGFFEKNQLNHSGWFYKGYEPFSDDEVLWCSIHFGINIWSGSSYVINISDSDEMGANFKPKIKYVHELQNVWYAITGQGLYFTK